MKKLTLPILTIAATIFAGGAFAFDPDDLQKLKDTNECVQCDLRDADLKGADLKGANLSGANLGKANLWEANLAGGNLTKAKLADGNLMGANLSGANLGKASLWEANLNGANLRDADLTYAIMPDVILCNTTMPDGSVIYSGCESYPRKIYEFLRDIQNK